MNKKNLLIFFAFIFCSASLSAQLYVNPTSGSDTNPGTSALPKQSLRGALRALTSSNSTIYIQEGDYPYATMTSNANRNLGFGPGQSVTSGINNAFLPGTIIEGIGCVYWHNSNDNGTGAQNSIMTVESVNGFTIKNIHFSGWQGSNASLMFINCTNVHVENCVFHQSALNSACALRFDGDAAETALAGTPDLHNYVDRCTFQNNGNPSGQGTGQALYIRNNGTSHLPPATRNYIVDVTNTAFLCNYAATGGAVFAMAQNNADEHPVVNFTACTFSGNNASSQGGAVYGKYANLNFLASGFCNNNANASLSDRDGGAIHADQGTILTVDNCTFQDNVAGRYGSAISIASNASSANVSNAVFYSNNAGNSTSSVIRSGGAPTSITNCLFKDNALTGSGGNVISGATVSNTTLSGNSGNLVSGSNVIDSHSLSVGVYIDPIGHAWDATNSAIGFTGTYSTMPNCSSCPTAPSVTGCKANGGGVLITNSATSRICGDLNPDGTLLNGSISLNNVSGFTYPACGMSTYRYYFIIIGEDGLIKKVILADDDADGLPNFAETPTVATNIDLSGLIPGTFSIQGIYSSTGVAPTVGSTTAAAVASQTCASISSGAISFKTCPSLTGNVFNDANGLNDVGGGIVNGPGTNINGQLYAILVDLMGNVVANSDVNAAGQYAFSVTPNTNYSIVLSTSVGTVGLPAPVASLPLQWFNTGENNSTNIGSDGTPNGVILVSVLTDNVSNINFGVDHSPISASYNTTIITPTLNTTIPFDASMYPNVVCPWATDLESGTLTNNQTILIDTLPTNATLLYNGVNVIAGVPIPNFNPSLLTVSLNTPGITSVTFNFSYSDPASVISVTPASYTISWTTPLPVTLLEFKGTIVEANTTLLEWTVADEINFNYYEILKSKNGSTFEKIGTVYAKGNRYYSFKDINANNKSFYKLAMVDIDNKINYSNIIMVESRANDLITIYPNPVTTNSINISISDKKIKSFYIIDMNGKSIQYMINTTGIYDISPLSVGFYEVYINGLKAVSFIKK